MEEQERLLVEDAQRNPLAFATLYKTYVGRLYNYIYQRTGNHGDAEDLTSRTFLKAFTNLEHYTFRGVPFSAWLYRIAHNAVANWYRDRSKHQMVSLDALVLSDKEDERLESVTQAREGQKELMDAVHRLPPERQQLLILKFSEGLTNVQIGQVLGRTEGAIKSLYHRTLLELRAEMKKERT